MAELPMKQMMMIAIVFGVVFAAFTVFLLRMPVTGTGKAGQTGTVGATINTELGIEVVAGYDVMNFGTLNRGDSRDSTPTSGNTVLPFLVRNVGNVMADVSVCAGNLWTSANRQPSDYRFSAANVDPRVPMDNCPSLGCFDTLNSQTTAANLPVSCPGGAVKYVNNLNWEDTKDEALAHIYVRVPLDEAPGAKTSTVTFTGLDSSTYAP